MIFSRLLVVLLAVVAPSATAILHTELFNSSAIDDPDITIRTELPGVQQAATEADLGPLLSDNLEPDLAPWRPPARPRQLSSSDLLAFLHEIDTQWPPYRRNFLALVLIRGGRMSWWAYPEARGWCTRRVKFIAEQFHGFMASHGLVFPDVFYVMNGYDKPLCPAHNCSAPIFSFDKRWDAAAYAAGRPGSEHEDILHPVMNHPFETLIDYPWEKKIEKAFMRVGVYAAMAANCSRVLVNRLASTREGRERLDVGIYQNRHWKVKVKTVPPVPMELHARWKYLLNTDGQSASWRLAKLMAINSAILKHRSDAIEYYYRSLRESVNYLSFDHTDLLPLLANLTAAGPVMDARLQSMAAANQAFAARYLSQLSRTLYAAVALRRYKELFVDMESFVREIPEGFTMGWFRDRRTRILEAATGTGTG